jgi:hypothetical protein
MSELVRQPWSQNREASSFGFCFPADFINCPPWRRNCSRLIQATPRRVDCSARWTVSPRSGVKPGHMPSTMRRAVRSRRRASARANCAFGIAERPPQCDVLGRPSNRSSWTSQNRRRWLIALGAPGTCLLETDTMAAVAGTSISRTSTGGPNSLRLRRHRRPGRRS